MELDPSLTPNIINLAKLLAIRHGKIVAVAHSVFRCKSYSLSMGGKPNGYHPRGMAIDVTFVASGIMLCPLEVAYIVQEHSNILQLTHFWGIGAMPKKNSMHLDLRPFDKQKTWVQEKDGSYTYDVIFKNVMHNYEEK
jgi:hypothetical protein